MTERYARQTVFQYDYRRSTDQDAPEPVRHPVVIVGAGPIGLATAIDLSQRQIPVVLVDDADRIGEGSRGLCYSKRSLDILDRLGVADRIIEKGITWQVGKVFFRDDLVYSFDLLPEEGHKNPAFVNLQQYYLEKYLVDRAGELDTLEIRWSNRLTKLEQLEDGSCLTLETPDGPYQIEADYLIAADGARSTTRSLLGLDFDGQIFEDKFLIADIHMISDDFPTERWFWFEPPFHGGQSTLLHHQADDVWRIDFQIGWDANAEEETRPEKVKARLDKMLQGTDYELVWVSVYTFQCRQLDRFIHDRVIFAGDAAHQVSPFGARGANSGFEDAENIAWKLEAQIKGTAGPKLLESYGTEREQGAEWNIGHSTRSTDFISPKSPMSMVFRNAVLDLSRHTDFARKMVNSGRLSNPVTYNTPLSTPDETEFTSTATLGYPVPDAPLVGADGQPVWLLNSLSDGFTLLVVDPDDTPEPIEGITIRIIGREYQDHTGAFRERYDARPGSCYLIRPDQHLTARWLSFDRNRIIAAYRRALGH